jgi:hypothetical protein
MYVGTAGGPPHSRPRRRAGVYDSRGLVDVEERGAEEQHGRDDHVGEERGDRLRLIPLAPEEDGEPEAGDEVDDRERGQ